MSQAFPLWLVVATMTIQVTILLYGAVQYRSLMSFCRSANASGDYEAVKNILILLVYSYGPFVIIFVTFAWIAYYQDWSSGAVLCFLPFVPILLLMITVLVTKNDISNMVDVNKKARTRLPAQGQAAFMAVVPRNAPGAGSPVGSPALPIQSTPVVPRTEPV